MTPWSGHQVYDGCNKNQIRLQTTILGLGNSSNKLFPNSFGYGVLANIVRGGAGAEGSGAGSGKVPGQVPEQGSGKVPGASSDQGGSGSAGSGQGPEEVPRGGPGKNVPKTGFWDGSLAKPVAVALDSNSTSTSTGMSSGSDR